MTPRFSKKIKIQDTAPLVPANAALRLTALGLLFTSGVYGQGFTFFDSPRLNDRGTIAFRGAFEQTPPVPNRFGIGIFLQTSDGQRIPVALRGQRFPAGFSFGFFDNDEIAINQRDEVLFSAVLLRDDAPPGISEEGVFLYSPSSSPLPLGASASLRETSLAAPGGKLIALMTAADLGEEDGQVSFFTRTSLALSDSGDAAFYFTSRDAQGEVRTRLFFRSSAQQETVELARLGQAAPGGGVFGTFGALHLNGQGELAFAASAGGQVNWYRRPPGGDLELALAGGQPLEELDGARPDLLLGLTALYADLNDSGTLAFAALLDSDPSQGVLLALFPSGRLQVAASERQTLPDHSRLQFDLGGRGMQVRINNSDQVVFGAFTNFLDAAVFSTDLQRPGLDFLVRGKRNFLGDTASLEIQGRQREIDVRENWGFNDSSQLFLTGFGSYGPLLVSRNENGQLEVLIDDQTPVPGRPGYSFTGLLGLCLNNRGDAVLRTLFAQGNPAESEAALLRISPDHSLSFPVAQGDAAALRLVFAQFADSLLPDGSFRTTLLLTNPSPSSTTAFVRFRDSQGEPLAVQVGDETADSFQVAVPPQGSRFLQTVPGQKGGSGYIMVEAGGLIGGTEVFTRSDNQGNVVTETGVPPSQPSHYFSLPLLARGVINTGIALVNAGSQAAAVTFEVRDRQGVLRQSAQRDLQAGSHLAIFAAGELFPEASEIEGLLSIRSTQPIHLVGLRSSPNTLSTLPQ